jgi:hypothetical protein
VGQTTYQIEHHIEKTRDDLGANLNELEYKVKEIADWRHHFRNHPMTMIGAAFGGGILLATMLGNGRRSPSTLTSRPQLSITNHKVADAWEDIKDALVGVAATRVTDFVADMVPGFHQEFEKVRSRSS